MFLRGLDDDRELRDCVQSRGSPRAQNRRRKRGKSAFSAVDSKTPNFRKVESSPRRSQLDSCFIERGTLQVNRLRRAAVIALLPWNAASDAKLDPKPAPSKACRDPLKLARYYQSLLDSGNFESRAALARYLGVSRPRVTQVLRRLGRNEPDRQIVQ
jgi:hypothetical protein